jgi:coenzyme F420-reducing hydrogenase gamma subunit
LKAGLASKSNQSSPKYLKTAHNLERERELRERYSSNRKSELSMAGTLKKCLCLIGFATAMFATPVMGVEVRNGYRLELSSGEPCSQRSLFVVRSILRGCN